MGNKVLFLFFIVVALAAVGSDRGVWAAGRRERDDETLDATIEIMDVAIETVDATIEDVDATIEDVDATIEKVDATIEDVDATIEKVDATIEDVDATIETDDKTPTKLRVLASVREFPLFLHKCMASFVNPSTLVATAACLVCLGQCKMYIRVLGIFLQNPNDPVYEVQHTLQHPLYEQNPSEYNIGIIYLKTEVPDAPVYDLPHYGIDLTHLPGSVYAWHFATSMKIFRLIRYKAHTISNELCSNYANEFVSNTYVCVVAKRVLQLGPFDHGTPMIVQGEKRGIIIGMFIKPGVVENGEVVEFTSLLPFLKWIQDNITPSPLPPTTTSKPTTHPTTKPTTHPTTKPTHPTTKPTHPTTKPTTHPTTKPTHPTTKPTTHPTTKPTTHPTTKPTTPPTTKPYTRPTSKPLPDPDGEQGRGQSSGLTFEGHVGGLVE